MELTRLGQSRTLFFRQTTSPTDGSTATMITIDNYANLVAAFSDLLLVSIHVILFEREIYPPSLFIAARKYNHPVRQARHPRVCQWIQDAVNACTEELLKCTVDLIAINILSPANKPLERFVFDVSAFPVVAPSDLHSPFVYIPAHDTTTNTGSPTIPDSQDASVTGGISTIDLEEQLRAVLTKLSYASVKLGKLPEECTFSVSMELKKDSPAPEGNPPVWVAAEYQGTTTGPRRQQAPSQRAAETSRTIPVRSLALGAMALETWIEEAVGKQELVRS
ncbi:DNA polymerase zeta processivity subunit [Drechslerella dactyloides]|uniref:DNA polymerase zeta processivity subunit n=1 Tax=Drechslerella dactyloides TaxID=74499 RepID=A0AAD6J7D8_DREDA|nr:DNA polymerase zeta processivity subunit [Drechslerella dactyloides]